MATEYADLFDDDDDMMVEASSEATKMKNLIDSDDEDDIGRTQHKSRPLLDDDASRGELPEALKVNLRDWKL